MCTYVNDNEAGLPRIMCETARPTRVSISPTNSEEQRLVESVLTTARGSPFLYESMLKSKQAPRLKEAKYLHQATELEWQQMCYDLSNFGSNQKLISAKPNLADKISGTARRLFEEGQIKVCLDDPGCGYQMATDNSMLLSSWPRSGNINVCVCVCHGLRLRGGSCKACNSNR